ncbi:MAG: DUF4062 domain-containing protein [Saprospiraceae bacterium]|nr:DUF4062 domain-containing protein [Saprospiraceae bacterium]
MIPKKKLQVFVSSTYVDLKEERQAAVEAILNAGHIPAGMELFAAGDQSQMEVIRRWIDESDVYLLILGGRYGSIEPESGKSYIHLEYEYAIEKGKPHFALVINEKHLDEKVAKDGRIVLEQDNNKEFKAFKQLVTAQKVVRFWSDLRDIKYFILESLNEFEKRENLIGWIKGDQAVDSGEIAEQLARLSKENAELRERLFSKDQNELKFNGLNFEELKNILKLEKIYLDDFPESIKDELIMEITVNEGDRKYITLFDGLNMFKEYLLKNKGNELPDLIYPLYTEVTSQLKPFDLTQNAENSSWFRVLTSIGRQFIFKLISEELKK